MPDPVPTSTREFARENRELLEYVLKHGGSVDIRAYAGAILIRGLDDPELDQVIDEIERGREALG